MLQPTGPERLSNKGSGGTQGSSWEEEIEYFGARLGVTENGSNQVDWEEGEYWERQLELVDISGMNHNKWKFHVIFKGDTSNISGDSQ